MKAFVVGLVIFVAVVVLGGIGFFVTYTGTYDKAVSYESNIKRLNDASKSDLSNFTLKVRDQAQIPAMYTNDLRSVIQTYFEGKGKQNESFIRSFVTQNLPNFNTKMYENLMATIDSGREAFNNTQKMKIDVCSDYNQFRKTFWNKKILAGEFPSPDIDKLCQVVSDAQTNTAFETGVQESLKLR